MTHRIFDKSCALVSLLTGAAGSVAAAEQPQNPWSFSIVGGAAAGIAGSLLQPTVAAVPDLAALDPALHGGGTATLGRLRYDDLFRPRYDAGVEFSYAMNSHVAVDTRLVYDSFAGRDVTLGQLTGPALDAPQPLDARIHDAADLSWQVGSRYRWEAGSHWRPFVGGALGITHLDDVRAQLVAGDPAMAARALDFTNDKHVFNQSVETGADLDLGRRFGLRFSVGAEHFGAPRGSGDATVALLGADVERDAQSRWLYPVEINAVFKLD